MSTKYTYMNDTEFNAVLTHQAFSKHLLLADARSLMDEAGDRISDLVERNVELEAELKDLQELVD